MEIKHKEDKIQISKLREKLRSDHEFFRMEMQRRDQVQGQLREKVSLCIGETVTKLTAYLRYGHGEHRSQLLDLIANLKTQLKQIPSYNEILYNHPTEQYQQQAQQRPRKKSKKKNRRSSLPNTHYPSDTGQSLSSSAVFKREDNS